MPRSRLSKRDALARLIGQPFLAPLRQKRGALRILAYHRLAPSLEAGSGTDFEADFEFDEQILSATTGAFEAQMRFAAQNFDIVSFSDLERCEIEGRAWPKRALIVTFDDGYRDNFTLAYPILRAMKIPATIFLATGHIGAQKLFWWDAIAYAFKKTPLSSVQMPELGNPELGNPELGNPEFGDPPFPLGLKTQKRIAIDAALGYAKKVSENERREFVAGLAARLEIQMPANVAAGMHLNWDEAREMARGGVEFGAHTVTHPILNRVDAAQLDFELMESKTAIERETGQRVLAFAYPAGTRKRRDHAARAGVERHGFRFAVAYDEGVEAHPDRFEMPRIHVDLPQSLPLFRANLLFPGLMLR